MSSHALRLLVWPGAEHRWRRQLPGPTGMEDSRAHKEAGGERGMAFVHSLVLFQLHQLSDPALNASRFYKPVHRAGSVVCNVGSSI